MREKISKPHPQAVGSYTPRQWGFGFSSTFLAFRAKARRRVIAGTMARSRNAATARGWTKHSYIEPSEILSGN